MSDYLGEALAIEEHRQGMAYGVDAGHCEGCAETARLRMQAECEHDHEQIDVTELGSVGRLLLCQSCGLVREVPR